MKKMVISAAVLLGLLFLLQLILGQSPSLRNYEFFPDMARSFAYSSQSANPHFANGRTQQPPVPGTIARGLLPLGFGPSEEESIRAGDELSNPFTPSDSEPGTGIDLERGKAVYEVYCRVCHGAGGQGGGPVVLRGYPAPASLLADNARNMQDGQIFHIISLGYRNMPAYGPLIDRTDRWHTIGYLRTLQENQP